MNQEIYNSYIENITRALSSGQKRTKTFSGLQGGPTDIFKSLNETEDKRLFRSLNDLTEISGEKTHYNQKPGEHPDFIHLKDGQSTENHYITSVFIDIKNSTSLFKKYYPDAVAYITSTIQRVAIHTCWYFDGYIQRYHGDGLFVYFGGKKIKKEDSLTQALTAASLFSYFVKDDLQKVFNEQGVENIYTRIGIDIGETEDVLWHKAGIGDCSEITTCSLHTSLAAKMQAFASENGIIVGDNVKNLLKLDSALYSVPDEKNRYIFKIPEENFNYTQWHFDWSKYLMTLTGIEKGINGKLVIRDNPSINKPTRLLNYNYLAEKGNLIKPWNND